MHNEYIKGDFNISHNLSQGYVTLYDRGGNHYKRLALDVPGYGLVPCSQKLLGDFTTDPEHLVLVINDENDIEPPYSSNIWISRTDIEDVNLFD